VVEWELRETGAGLRFMARRGIESKKSDRQEARGC